MKVVVKKVENKKELKQFIDFPFTLYKNEANWVPPLKRDDWQTFERMKNPAYETAEAIFFLAFDHKGKVLGRIAGIDSRAANDKFVTNNIRFGWFESIDSLAVASALVEAVENWGKKIGRNSITGPQGFTDFDPQGLLIEGFEHTPTIVGGFNKDYYQHFFPELGYNKEIDYLEFSVDILDDPVPERLKILSERIRQRSRIRLVEYDNLKDLIKERAHEIFDLLEETFQEIYGAVPLTSRQVDFFIKKYISFVDPRLIKLAVDEQNRLVAFLLTMPSMSWAFQKAKGYLFPLGFWYLWRALKTYDVLDFYLAGISKKHRGSGIDLLLTMEIAKTAQKMGFKRTESNLELETNTKIQATWKHFNPKQLRKRRIYTKQLI